MSVNYVLYLNSNRMGAFSEETNIFKYLTSIFKEDEVIFKQFTRGESFYLSSELLRPFIKIVINDINQNKKLINSLDEIEKIREIKISTSLQGDENSLKKEAVMVFKYFKSSFKS